MSGFGMEADGSSTTAGLGAACAAAAACLCSAIRLCACSKSLASASARIRSSSSRSCSSLSARSARRWRSSLARRSSMIALGPRIPRDGEPVCMGGAVGRVEGDETPLETAGCPPTRRISAMEAFSSTRSGVKGLGCRNASSTAQRIALWVCLDMWTKGWVDEGSARREDVLGGTKEGGSVVEASSRGSLSKSWESFLVVRRRSDLGRGTGGSSGSAVAKKASGPKPTVTASRCVRLGGDSGGGGLGVPTKRGVRRKGRCDRGVDLPDAECSGEIGVSVR